MNEQFITDLDTLIARHNMGGSELITHLMFAMSERYDDNQMLFALKTAQDALRMVMTKEAN